MAEASYILADLPSSPAGSGDILVADVHTIAGGSKKKRSELAVAIDNESVNLYDVSWSPGSICLWSSNGTARFGRLS